MEVLTVHERGSFLGVELRGPPYRPSWTSPEDNEPFNNILAQLVTATASFKLFTCY